MALKIQGRYELRASPQQVWETMLQPQVLSECIPGCESLEADGDSAYRATVTTKVGPIRATFRGRVELSDIEEPQSVRLSGAGEGGIAGHAKGFALIELSSAECPNITILTYEGDVAIGGKIAQLGSRLIQSVARRLADQFFDKLATKFNASEETI